MLPRSHAGEPVPELGGPAVRAVEATLRRALAAHASDVHVEPASDGGGTVRLRVDGILRAAEPLGRDLYASFVSRWKILAGLDITNRRLPQDGRFTAVVEGRTVDARVASIATIDGEKLAIRLLDHSAALPRLDDLGMDARTLGAYRALAHAPWGFVVVSGPTGSGKTTTLYASLAELDRGSRNVCTVEDPIEARLAGTVQVQVNVRAGLTFPAVLRAFVRQDPDVIMIGEIRDAETCAVGVAAALAGQTVFATVHSTDAPRTVDRLVELGVARRSLAAALTAVVAQRLVRKLCESCRRRTGARWFAPSACPACAGTGYRGRVGVFELLVVDDGLRDAIASGASSAALARRAAAAGHRALSADAVAKLDAGITSLEEIERVVGGTGPL
jgi:general secretion pathway protein E